MKVYATRDMTTEYGFMSVIGWHKSLNEAKKQGTLLNARTAEWDVALYETPTTVSLDMWLGFLNGDSVSSQLDGSLPRDHLTFVKIAFESAALKRWRKELAA